MKCAAQALCEASGMTQEQVCRKSRLSKPTLQRLARHGRAHWATARQLARILDCHPDVFLFGYYDYLRGEAQISGADATALACGRTPKVIKARRPQFSTTTRNRR